MLIPTSPAWSAQTYPACPIGQTPSFVFGFAALRQHLGPAMGDPVECEHTDPATGDALQRTTTGLAVYRRDTNTSMFTNGQEHWALTTLGPAHWSGWHGNAAPLAGPTTAPIEGAQATTAQSGPFMSVEAVTVADILDEHGQQVVVRREETPYLIETERGCVIERRSVGEVIYVVSSDVFAGPDSRIILVLGDRECRITEGRAL
jgi:hypothetical protein